MRAGGMLRKIPCSQVTSFNDEETGFFPWSARQMAIERDVPNDVNAQTHPFTTPSNPQSNTSTNLPPPPSQANLPSPPSQPSQPNTSTNLPPPPPPLQANPPSPPSQPSQTTNPNQESTIEAKWKPGIFYDNPVFQDDSWSECELVDEACEKESFFFPLLKFETENKEIVIQSEEWHEKEKKIVKNVASLMLLCAFMVINSYVECGKTKENKEVVETIVVVGEKGRCEERRRRKKKKRRMRVVEKKMVEKKKAKKATQASLVFYEPGSPSPCVKSWVSSIGMKDGRVHDAMELEKKVRVWLDAFVALGAREHDNLG